MSERPPDHRGQNPGHQPRVSRRAALKSIAQVGATGAALGTVTTPAVASHADEKYRSSTITFDREWLETYSPMLDLRDVPVQNHPTLYGWKVTSNNSEIEYDVGVYAAGYALQRDVWTVTSHAGDHEWVYVFVDRRTGEIDHVSYTAYHWLRGYVSNPAVYTDDGGVHPTLKVAPTYHNYIPQNGARDSSVLLDVSSLGDSESRSGPLYRWLANGMESDLATGAVHHPWNLSKSGPMDDWWSRQGFSSINFWIVRVWSLIGIKGADRADFGEADPAGWSG